MHFLLVAIAAAIAQHDLVGTVVDSASGKPIVGADLVLRQSGSVVARSSTDPFGAYILHDIADGGYELEARYIGYRAERRPVQIGGPAHAVTLMFRLVAVPLQLQDIEVSASVPVAVDTRTGDQVFKQTDYHGAPTNTTSQILQQSISGAARAPTGEVHIRGQHAEYTYYVDGIPVPAGISGSLNELFDPSVVNQINFQTGSWDAEYGGKNAAIINVTTRIPSGGFHASASGYGGDYANNGQTLTASGNSGKWGLFFAGTRTATDMRREPVQAVVDTNSAGQITNVRSIQNFSNH